MSKMNKKRTLQALSMHADGLIGRSTPGPQMSLTNEERSQLTPLFQLAERLSQSMQPVQPSAGFVRSLGKELAGHAKHQVVLTKRMRKTVLIGAAAVGSLVSIASLVGAIVFIIARWRERSQARAI
jgi:hypothetical protein